MENVSCGVCASLFRHELHAILGQLPGLSCTISVCMGQAYLTAEQLVAAGHVQSH
jgi:hypothetical protein